MMEEVDIHPAPTLRAFDEDELKKIPDKVDKQMATLLTRLQTPFVCDNNSNTIEGYLYKRQRKMPHKWVLFRYKLCGNTLSYYANTSKKPRGIIPISFASGLRNTTEHQLLEIKNSEVSKKHILLFSPHRLDTIAGANDEELASLHANIDRIIREGLSKDEATARDKAVEKFIPLMEQKTSQEVDRLLLMIAELEQSGFAKDKLKKDKTGNLEMMVAEDDASPQWEKYYFVLQNQCLYYYKTSKAPPKGIITLKYTIIQSVPENPETEFTLTTPLNTFHLRAKHAIALEEWINAIETSKAGKKKDATPKLKSPKIAENANLLSDDSDEDAFTDLNKVDPNQEPRLYGKKHTPQLTYMLPNGKKKVIKLPMGPSVIGRSDSCSITLDDKQVSRSHCKIEITENAAVILDIGSGHGTKVNKRRVDKYNLQSGDVIKVGATKIKFEAVKK